MSTSFAERLQREIADRKLPSEVTRHLDEWLKADRDFNVWFLITTKRALKDAELTALLDGYQESQEIVEEAWSAFEANADATTLAEGIARSIDRMNRLRSLV